MTVLQYLALIYQQRDSTVTNAMWSNLILLLRLGKSTSLLDYQEEW